MDQAVGVSYGIQLVESHRVHRPVRTPMSIGCAVEAHAITSRREPSPMQLLVLP